MAIGKVVTFELEAQHAADALMVDLDGVLQVELERHFADGSPYQVDYQQEGPEVQARILRGAFLGLVSITLGKDMLYKPGGRSQVLAVNLRSHYENTKAETSNKRGELLTWMGGVMGCVVMTPLVFLMLFIIAWVVGLGNFATLIGIAIIAVMLGVTLGRKVGDALWVMKDATLDATPEMDDAIDDWKAFEEDLEVRATPFLDAASQE